MKVNYEGINKVDEQVQAQVKHLAGTIANKIEKTEGMIPETMRTKLAIVPAHQHIATGRTELQIKLFFNRGPFFLHNPAADKILRAAGFAPFTHGYVKYCKQA